jgi:hypothetical protein
LIKRIKGNVEGINSPHTPSGGSLCEPRTRINKKEIQNNKEEEFNYDGNNHKGSSSTEITKTVPDRTILSITPTSSFNGSSLSYFLVQIKIAMVEAVVLSNK